MSIEQPMIGGPHHTSLWLLAGLLAPGWAPDSRSQVWPPCFGWLLAPGCWLLGCVLVIEDDEGEGVGGAQFLLFVVLVGDDVGLDPVLFLDVGDAALKEFKMPIFFERSSDFGTNAKSVEIHIVAFVTR